MDTTSDVILDASPATEAAAAPPISSMAMRDALHERFRRRIAHNAALDRTLVSFQRNKNLPFFGWFKYREGFSEPLVTYLLKHLHPQPGVLLDPFAGGGAALFAAGALGWRTKGIEVLPVGIHAMQARMVAERVDVDAFAPAIARLAEVDFTAHYTDDHAFTDLCVED